MNVTTETATVYRGGGRRWFSRSAAINAEASKALRLWVRATGRCDCSKSPRYHDEFDTGPEICKYCDYSGEYAHRLYAKTVALIARKAAA